MVASRFRLPAGLEASRLLNRPAATRMYGALADVALPGFQQQSQKAATRLLVHHLRNRLGNGYDRLQREGQKAGSWGAALVVVAEGLQTISG